MFFSNFFFNNLSAIYVAALTYLMEPWYFLLMLRIQLRKYTLANLPTSAEFQERATIVIAIEALC